jgi:hypothetical protein
MQHKDDLDIKKGEGSPLQRDSTVSHDFGSNYILYIQHQYVFGTLDLQSVIY